jgi:hypothetical protein
MFSTGKSHISSTGNRHKDRVNNATNTTKDRFRPKDSYDWIREELVVMKGSEQALLSSLQESCSTVCDICDEVYDDNVIQDSVSGVVYLRRLLRRLVKWKRNLELNPAARRRSGRSSYTDSPNEYLNNFILNGQSKKEIELTKEVSYVDYSCIELYNIYIYVYILYVQLEDLKAKYDALQEENKRLTEIANAR